MATTLDAELRAALGRGLRRRAAEGREHDCAGARFLLPHYRLIAYQRCEELLLAVLAAEIRDASLRDQASRAAKGACLNIIEAVGRTGTADKKRVFGIARGEAAEAVMRPARGTVPTNCPMKTNGATTPQERQEARPFVDA